MQWTKFFHRFDKTVLKGLGADPSWMDGESNPITDALKQGDFVERFQDVKGFNRIKVSRLATICQMIVFDRTEGPEGDGQSKALRRHWYAWYKVHFAQPFAKQLGDVKVNDQGIEEIDDRIWSGRMSQTYAKLVDRERVTYKDLWVEDASRMMTHNWEVLFGGCHIVLAVEKDSLFADFKAAAKALGAKAVYSGKGKSSKAAIEKMLRDYFNLAPEWNSSPFSPETPLIILHISDHDFDGEAVIGPTFGEQARRYTDSILEARVGILPESVDRREWADKWYTVKVSNSGYESWAEQKGLFLARCLGCGEVYPIQSMDGWGDQQCPECGGVHEEINLKVREPHGFEVEALRTREYYGLIVDALLRVLPFEYIVNRLRDECTASPVDAAGRISREVLKENQSYQALLEEFDRLEEIKREFEERIRDQIQGYGEGHEDDWRDLEDDPEPEEFRGYVIGANAYSGPWRPFSREARTTKMVEWIQEEHGGDVQELVDEVIEW